jgi:hypothetical protein
MAGIWLAQEEKHSPWRKKKVPTAARIPLRGKGNKAILAMRFMVNDKIEAPIPRYWTGVAATVDVEKEAGLKRRSRLSAKGTAKPPVRERDTPSGAVCPGLRK